MSANNGKLRAFGAAVTLITALLFSAKLETLAHNASDVVTVTASPTARHFFDPAREAPDPFEIYADLGNRIDTASVPSRPMLVRPLPKPSPAKSTGATEVNRILFDTRRIRDLR
jgi:hypothetical protein